MVFRSVPGVKSNFVGGGMETNFQKGLTELKEVSAGVGVGG